MFYYLSFLGVAPWQLHLSVLHQRPGTVLWPACLEDYETVIHFENGWRIDIDIQDQRQGSTSKDEHKHEGKFLLIWYQLSLTSNIWAKTLSSWTSRKCFSIDMSRFINCHWVSNLIKIWLLKSANLYHHDSWPPNMLNIRVFQVLFKAYTGTMNMF